MLAAPLAIHEWLERTAGQSGREKWAGVTRATRRIRTSPVFLFLAVYLVALAVIIITGGFAFDVSGQRVSVRSVGNSGIVVFYILLFRLAYLHRRGRIDWHRLMDADTRVRPLLIWFAVPVTVWLASPHPNHIRDVLNLVVNRPLGEATVRTGTASYLQSLGNDYFISPWLAAVVAGACLIAALSYARQPRVMRLVIAAIPLQFAAIAVHQTRFPRFLLLTVVLVCLVAAGEIGRWIAGARARGIAWGVSIALVLTAAVSVNQLVSAERFTAIAFEHYTDAPALKQALAAIRRELQPGDRLLIVGQSNILSPALLRWELGPPSGGPAYPFRIGGQGRLHPDDASHVLVLVPLGDAGVLDPERNDPARLRALQESIDRGRLVLRSEWPVRDPGVVLRFYGRPKTAD